MISRSVNKTILNLLVKLTVKLLESLSCLTFQFSETHAVFFLGGGQI